ncbi:hypothetical protein ACIRRA_44680 [Nocardia sp. NPDC101769]|uniref:hypothetical protein n=1 Tax=Nocardia sp. NPDC101769 TaxID=3364333 RepID=UPI00381A7CD7
MHGVPEGPQTARILLRGRTIRLTLEVGGQHSGTRHIEYGPFVFFLCLLFLFPVLCWALAAQTRRGRWAGVTVLTIVAGVQIPLQDDVFGTDFQAAVGVVLAVFVIVVLIVAPIMELAPTRVVPPGRGAKVRIGIGWTLGGLYCLFSGFVVLVVTATGLMELGTATMPPADAIGSLPEGLSMTKTEAPDCANDSDGTDCERTFYIAGTSGTPEQVAEQVRQYLTDSKGWTFTPEKTFPDDSGTWKGSCWQQGWILDSYQACTWVEIKNDGRVAVVLSHKDID